ncbi:hypothetical protein G6M89_08835 [Natronolimnobius sp. AArcel1]|uniref:hypothetical protein n=1 Tax=Natronolimnobius sp. AArcel1 TaxID=1679093 RepID=UPI0013EB8C7C|nr:hypothetical protein [Natronolimnobius sp. AArcel1]NGM69110.1 hypothetical protein [Natronolimnobius sp. AArcel1]
MQLTRRMVVALGGLLSLGLLERLHSIVTANESATDSATNSTETETDETGDSDTEDDETAWTLPDDSPLEEIATVAIDAVDEDGLEEPMLSITNTDEDDRSLTLRIDFEDADEPALEATDDLPGETVLEVVAGEPGTYETMVESGSLESTTSISASADCLAHTEITLGDSGVSMNTSMSC